MIRLTQFTRSLWDIFGHGIMFALSILICLASYFALVMTIIQR